MMEDAPPVPDSGLAAATDDAQSAGQRRPAGRLREWRRRLSARLRGTPGEDAAARLATLAQAIEAHPDAPANYVLRGELWLALGDPTAAAANFRQALERAERALEASAWGIIAQAVRDRALAGLAEAERRTAFRRPDEFGLHYRARSEDVSEMERW